MGNTKIEWADAVWNPITGCTPVSEGCKNCYAKRMASRLRGRFGYPEDDPFRPGTVHVDVLWEPEQWKKPRRVFVGSMGDLFHEAVPYSAIGPVLDRASRWTQHTFLLLTKRPDRMAAAISHLYGDNGPTRNVWLGVSVENQARADERIPVLLQIPAAKRFVSLEPLLGPVDLSRWLSPRQRPIADGYGGDCAPGWITDFTALDWVIVGGETGPGARPMHPDWVRSVRDQCVEAGVPFWFKGWGEWIPLGQKGEWNAERLHLWDDSLSSSRVGKRRSGAMLDGRRWEQIPAEVA